jgi:glycosyltransferase involved in cell wall biosynthesis
MDQKTRVCIITTVHDYYDTRIFYKQAKALLSNGYEVTLIAPGDNDIVVSGVRVVSVKRATNRLFRFLFSGALAYKKATAQDYSIIHFHDPEFIPFALLLKLKRKIVIYDVHEDVPSQILSKEWIWRPVRKLTSKIFNLLEKKAALCFDTVITATPVIACKFKQNGTNLVVVQNYPVVSRSFILSMEDYNKRPYDIAYIGSISVIRGIKEMIEALKLINESFHSKLILCGKFETPTLKGEIEHLLGWNSVEYLGWLDRDRVDGVLKKARIGLVILHPMPRYILSQPNKLFEYMAAGIPVVASNFPLWEEIVGGNKCGLNTDPYSVEAIANAIHYLFKHPDEAF